MRRTISFIAVAASIVAGGVDAQDAHGNGSAPQAIILPGTRHVLRPANFTSDASGRSLKQLQLAIADWLAHEFGLPRTSERATIAFASPNRMARLRFRDVSAVRSPDDRSEIVAVYSDETGTIYLPIKWTGETAADLSVLVHETVHHLQNVGRLKFACAEEREKMAFAAQEHLLGLFGGSLERDLGLDPFTILVRTNCHP